MLAASMRTEPAKERIVLQFQDVRYDSPVGVSYLLFLNLPADARNPDHAHPNFIGTPGFLGGVQHGDLGVTAAEGLTEEYDVTRKDLQELLSQLKPCGNPRSRGSCCYGRRRSECSATQKTRFPQLPELEE